MRKLMIAAVLLGSVVSVPVQADAFRSAKDLMEVCKSKDATQQQFCRGYIMAAVDSYNLYDEASHYNVVCLPPNTSYDVIRDVVIRFLDANPDKLQYTAVSEVMLALMDKYPCPGRK